MPNGPVSYCIVSHFAPLEKKLIIFGQNIDGKKLKIARGQNSTI